MLILQKNNTMLIPILFSVSYLLACFGVASASENKKVGAQSIFHIAVLFTPLIAVLVVVLSPKKKVVQSQLLNCKKCGLEYPEKHIIYPECAKEGITFLEQPCKS